jgi:probable addiction module antidote protein
VRALGKVRTTEEKIMPAKQAARYDAAEFLECDADIVTYLNAAIEDGDSGLASAALGDIARARDMAQLAKEAGITRDGLHTALSQTGSPSFTTIQ